MQNPNQMRRRQPPKCLKRQGMRLALCLLLSQSVWAINCSVSTTPIGFGNYDVFSTTNLDSTGSVTVRCSPANTSYTISLEAGLSGGINNRRMQAATGNDKLKYNLYIDAARSTIWGNGTGGSTTLTNTALTPNTVYGRIPAGQNVSVGSYSDSVTVIVSF